MRLIQLTLTAFGPYKDKEIIDFAQLEDNKLFVISGATGAGKTTIFDAICFALYGSASGSDRDQTTMLRSQFAADDVHTAVELIFMLRNKSYRVLRQIGHVKQGNKTKTGERYELYEIVGETEYPIVDRQIVSEINDKIEGLIGLTVEQFKQIVMLPQGEFRKLLTSSTENKEEILRKLFQTGHYQKLNGILKDKLTQLTQLSFHEKQLLENNIHQIHSALQQREDSVLFSVLDQDSYQTGQIISGLTDEINHLQNKITHEDNLYNQSLVQYENKYEELTKATFLNSRFVQLREKKIALQNLLNQADTIKEKQIQLEMAERASKIEPYARQLKDREDEKTLKEKAVHKQKSIFIEAEQKLTAARDTYFVVQGKSDHREQVGKELARYEEFLPVVREITNEKKRIEQMKNQNISTEQHLANILMEEKRISEQEEGLTKEINTYESEIVILPNKQNKQLELRGQYVLWKDYVDQKREEFALQNELIVHKQSYEQAEQKVAYVEQQWFKEQAAVLAEQLHDGEACPVCGSMEHPNKHHIKGEFVSKEEIDKQKQILQNRQQAYHTVAGKMEGIQVQLEKISFNIGEQDVPLTQAKEKMEQIKSEGIQLKEEVETLTEKLRDLQDKKLLREKIVQKLKQLATEKEKLTNKLMMEQANASAAEATFTERIRMIPEEMQQLTTLEQKIKEFTKLKESLIKEWEMASEQLKQAEINHSTAEANLKNNEKQLAEMETYVQTALNSFNDQLAMAKFDDVEAYERAKLSEAERLEIGEIIEKYQLDRASLTEQVKQLELELKDEKPANLEALNEVVQQLKQQYEIALNRVNESRKSLDVAEQIKNNIVEIEKKAREIEHKLTIMQDIYDVLRGNNSKKISFERYLQIDFLDQIIYAANSRFKGLSDGQYHLIRSDRQESHGRQSGLAIDVYDAYTGQTRHVKTLSGGEKFIASLSLALGMADVIQSFQGSIQIDTMFIDEGFGSLDEESLHKSIEALVELQETGRTIGVISHVEELKRMFPALLEVTKMKEGHSKARFVIR